MFHYRLGKTNILTRRTGPKRETEERKNKVQFYIPPRNLPIVKAELGRRKISNEELPHVLIEYANRGYLACMLDEGHIHVSRSKKTDKPLSAKIRFEKSNENIKRVYAFMIEYFGVRGEMSSKDYRNTPTHRKAVEAGVSRGKEKPTHLLTISDPSDVRELCKKALPFSERPGLLLEAIDACNRKLGEASSAL